jgi:BirA family biotin operon repressor/biotin-[acetyl-CoA-carboxylase] ligase
LADSSFELHLYYERLTTRWMGRALMTLAATDSTNDVAWTALEHGAIDGFAVVADAQLRGRGRAGRAWHTAPGKGLALSLLLHRQASVPVGLLPLASGLALARALDRLGAEPRLKWPNDLLLGGGKVAGILAEARGAEGLVVGFGVNVAEREEDFPPELADSDRPAPTSLAMEGITARREEVAAALFDALEPLWTDLVERGREPLLRAWTERASFWGERVTARTEAGARTGIARALDSGGGLILELEDGSRVTVLAGDVDPVATPQTTPR